LHRGLHRSWPLPTITVMASRVERHLCVIFAADVAGYSRLMRSDEEGTLAQLVKARETMDDLVTAHRGRVVNSVGHKKRTLDSLFPGITIAMLRAKRFSEVPKYLQMAETYWYAGLRKAGVPEQ
jgi:hypothetical protein